MGELAKINHSVLFNMSFPGAERLGNLTSDSGLTSFARMTFTF